MKAKAKRVTATKKKGSMITNLHDYIAKAYSSLEKVYRKELSAVQKSIAGMSKHVVAFKKKVAKNKKPADKKKAAMAHMNLRHQLDALKAKASQLVVDYKKHVAREKALAAFEKDWVKKNKTSNKSKKPRKSKARVSDQTGPVQNQ